MSKAPDERDVEGARSRSQGPVTAFDGLIARVREVFAGAPSRPAPEVATLPFAVGEHAGRGVVLKSRTAVELGGPGVGSCAMTMTTADTSLVVDGRVTLLGPDVPEMARGTVAPFAQVVLAAGAGIEGASHQRVEDCQSVKDYVEGYFVRSAPGEVWSRVGDALYAKGFALDRLGAAIMQLVRSSHAGVEAVEVLFATSPEAVAALCALTGDWKEASHSLRRDAWLGEGVDIDCPSGGHCGSCADKGTCDRVRQIARLRKAAGEHDDDGENEDGR